MEKLCETQFCPSDDIGEALNELWETDLMDLGKHQHIVSALVSEL